MQPEKVYSIHNAFNGIDSNGFNLRRYLQLNPEEAVREAAHKLKIK